MRGWVVAEWMPGVERIPTAAVGGKITPRGVMSHVMQGWQATMIRWARERPRVTRKSAHFTIGRDGRVVQHVPIRRQAWHAGRLDRDAPPRWSLLPAGANPNDYAIGIEHEGFSGEPWPETQVRGHDPRPPLAVRRARPRPVARDRDRPLHDRARLARGGSRPDVAARPHPRRAPRGHPDSPAVLTRADYERSALRAYLGVRGHSYRVREDDEWQYIEIRRPKPVAAEAARAG